MVFLAIIPQLNLWITRGKDWNGSYISYDFDEPAYSAYLQALINGRPRRNNPYTGQDDQPLSPQAESLYSIQFLPAYILALFARLGGFSALTVFITLRILSSFVSGLTVFWLFSTLLKNERVAVMGSLVVLCLGSYAGSTKALALLLTLHPTSIDFPFLRSYVPALPFPLFFALCTFTLKAVTSNNTRVAIKWAALVGVCFAALVFSYFFLWTAAAAWFSCLVLLWFWARPACRWHLTKIGTTVGLIVLAALIPYVLLILNRAHTMDAAQLLTSSHAVDFFHLSEILGGFIILVLLLAVRRGFINPTTPPTLFAISFALLPLILFNQQVVTGYSLQPLHYERYIAPYSVIAAAILTATLLLRARLAASSRVLTSITVVIVCWVALETIITSHKHLAVHIRADQELGAVSQVATMIAAPERRLSNRPPVVFFTSLSQADLSTTRAYYAVLWSQHMIFFSGLTFEENKERLFRYLYFSGVDEHQFGLLLSTNSYLSLALFGYERVWRRDTGQTEAISVEDVLNEQRSYARYILTFDRERAAEVQLDYVVIPSQNGPDISNLDRWYDRWAGERVNDVTIYRLKLRP